jgi:hypothetical protein
VTVPLVRYNEYDPVYFFDDENVDEPPLTILAVFSDPEPSENEFSNPK